MLALALFFLHPLGACSSGPTHDPCLGYNFWSGIAGSFILGGGIWVGAITALRHRNCHVRGCWRIGRHPVEGTSFVVCRKHHPDDSPTAEQIREAK